MGIYITFLRGINVGGHHKVKMAALREMFEALGYRQVKSYIQSGNVLFESELKEDELRRQISEKFEASYGYPVSVILRTAGELERILGNCPFSEDQIKKAEAASEAVSLYVALLPEAPLPEAAEQLIPYGNEEEHYQISGREVYLLFHQSIRDSKLAIHLKKLGVTSTVRNWKTMNKLNTMAEAMKP